MASIEETAPSHGFAAYRRVLGAPGVAPLVLASVAARLPVGMGAVALVLYIHGVTGSFAAAGAAAGAYTIGLGITGPLLARVIDRHGSGPVVLPAGLLSSAALVAVVALGHADAGPAVLAIAAGVSGAAAPPLGSVVRLQYPRLVGAHDMTTTYALDAILIEVLFIAGPLLAGVLAATVGAGDGLLVAAAIGAVGIVWFSTVSQLGRSEHPHERHWAGALVSPGIRLLVFTGVPVGVTFGALDVALPAFGTLHGSSALGGPLAATLALGSAVGGLAYGLRPYALGTPRRAFLLLGPLQAATCLPILIVTGLPEMFIAAAIAGLCVAPLGTARNQLIQQTMPPGTGTEAFTWQGLSITLGASAGAAVAGPLVEAGGWQAGAVLACAVPAAGALLAFLGRDALRSTST
jgi:MFS family permease